MSFPQVLTGVAHIGIPTNDLDKTIAFYKKLGFVSALETVNKAAGERVAFLQLGDLMIETYENHRAAEKAGAIDHVALATTDIEAAFAAAKEAGMHLLHSSIQSLPFWENGVRFFMVEGPNLLKVSEEEMQLITNKSDLARGSQALLEMGPSLVLVSLGAKGAYYRNAVGAGHLPTYDVPTVDTTGAGDAFMGAIHYQLRGKDAEDLRTLPAFELEEIVRFGNAAGSLTTTKGGAIPAMPSMVEIQNCIASIPLL